MSKIRWRSKDSEELRKAVDRFNKKISYWENKGKDILPDRVYISDLKSNINTRQDFNNIINSLARFSRRGAEDIKVNPYGVAVTNWELNEYHIKRAVRNRTFNQRKARLQNLEIDLVGFDEPLTRSEMGREDAAVLRPMTNRFKTAQSLNEFRQSMKTAIKQSKSSYWLMRDEIYKTNYINALERELGHIEGVNDIIEYIDNLSGSELYRINLSNPDTDIDFIYLYPGQIAKVDHLKNVYGLTPTLTESELTTKIKSSIITGQGV